LVTPQIKYNVLYDPGLEGFVDNLKELVPEGVNMEFSTTDSFKDENAPLYVFAYIGTTGSPKPWKGEQLGVEVTVNPGNLSGGLRFLKKKGSSWNFVKSNSWEKQQLLLGAIISGDGEIFDCIRNQAMKRVEIMSAILLQKLDMLDDLDPNKYSTAEAILNSMHTSAINKQLRVSDMHDLKWQNTILSYETVPQIY